MGAAMSRRCDALKFAAPSTPAAAASKSPRSPRAGARQKDSWVWSFSTSPALKNLQGQLHGILHVGGGLCVIDFHELHVRDRKSTRLNSSHSQISYAVFCLKKKTI